MDFNIVYIALTLLGILIFSLIITGKTGISRQKELYKTMLNQAKTLNSHIGLYEVREDFAMGLDEKEGIAYFIRRTKSGIATSIVKLSEIIHCLANNVYVTINKEKELNFVDKLEIIFQQNDQTKQDISWEIYNSDQYHQLNGEVQLVEKWVNILESLLRKTQNSD